MKGLFVTFEGIDGSGKSTQISMLSEELTNEGIPFVLIREPGATSIGEKIRTILLDKENSKMHARTELLLYEAARAQIVEERIRPDLEAGKVVICDRFYDSTVAYQGYAIGLSLDAIGYLNDWSTGGLAVNTFLTILLIILAIALVVLAVLYFVGRKMQAKQVEQEAMLEANKQTVSMLIIDKRKDPRLYFVRAHVRFQKPCDLRGILDLLRF